MIPDYIKELFKKDLFVAHSGIELISVDGQKAVAGAKIMPYHLNAAGVIQGGLLFTLADFAFAALANYLHPITLSQSGSISYVAASRTDYVTAEATELVRNNRTCVCQVVVKDADGSIITTATINGFIKDAN